MPVQTHLADFHGYPIEIVDYNNQPWITGEQVGKALGMKHARTNIRKLYDRHSDEFTDDMTGEVNVDSPSGVQKTRIFSPRGCWMLGMWSQTDKAKMFRQWILDVLEKETAQPPPQLAPPALPAPGIVTVDPAEYIDLLKDKIRLLEDLNTSRTRRNFTDSEKIKMRELRVSGKNIGEIARTVGRSDSGVRSYLVSEGLGNE